LVGFSFFLLGLLVDDIQHLSLDSFLFEGKSILVPDEVRSFCIIAVSLHAALEQVDDISIIRVLSECKAPAVVHELLEFIGTVLAEIFNLDFFLLLFDVSILLGFRFSWKALPGECSF